MLKPLIVVAGLALLLAMSQESKADEVSCKEAITISQQAHKIFNRVLRKEAIKRAKEFFRIVEIHNRWVNPYNEVCVPEGWPTMYNLYPPLPLTI